MCVSEDGRVFLADLGAAKKLQVRLSTGPVDYGSVVRLSTFVGSPAAMAPVRPRALPHDLHADRGMTFRVYIKPQTYP